MVKIIFVLFLIGILYFQSNISFCSADLIRTKDGASVSGVVIEEKPDEVLFWTTQGEKVIKKSDIDNIDYSSEEDNIISMADDAKAKSDYVKAYYLYQKVFRLNLNSKPAIDGMKAVQKYLNVPKEGDAISTYSNRFQGAGNDTLTDDEALSDNASQTEDVLNKFGIIIGGSDNKTYYLKTKVLDVRPDSRGAKAGVQINDYVVGVGTTPTDYLGLFGTVSLMLDQDKGKLDITLEREVQIWFSGSGRLKDYSEFSPKGFTLEKAGKGFVVGSIDQSSAAYRTGLRDGDVIVSIDNNFVISLSKEEVFGLIDKNGLAYSTVTIRRKVTL